MRRSKLELPLETLMSSRIIQVQYSLSGVDFGLDQYDYNYTYVPLRISMQVLQSPP